MELFDWFRGTAGSTVRFRMPVDDAFAIEGSGKVIVVGVVTDGEVRPGDRLVLRTPVATVPVTVKALEAYSEPLQVAQRVQVAHRGDRVGIMLVGADITVFGYSAVLMSTAVANAEPDAAADPAT